MLVVFAFSGLFAANAQNVPRSYIAHKTNEPIVIDGKMDENAWKLAPWSEDYIDIEGEVTPIYRTRMKMLWDNDYLYVLAEMEEPHVWATLKQRDTVIFYNNDFEIFIDAEGDTHNYYEFEMNAHNT
ncbi:MAG: carbohydrate-binding family 9-like protein, partial [Arenibacter latericius]|nr:carbohydrate-binding family 9-like protein [Arenibacter latericius]